MSLVVCFGSQKFVHHPEKHKKKLPIFSNMAEVQIMANWGSSDMAPYNNMKLVGTEGTRCNITSMLYQKRLI